MTISDGLTLVTLIVATISMLLSCIALWPQSKKVLSFARDVVLWMVAVFVFVGVATLGWRHYRVHYQPPSVTPPEAAWQSEPGVVETSLQRRPIGQDPAYWRRDEY